jgi:cellulose synthase (UDP-forming)
LGICAWLKKHCLLRPWDAPILCWESLAFPILRWPQVTWGVLKAIQFLWSEPTQVWKVTPKRKGGESDIPFKLLIPYLLLITISLATFALSHPTPATGWYSTFNLINAAIYTFLTILVVHLNRRERGTNRRWQENRKARFAATRAVAVNS